MKLRVTDCLTKMCRHKVAISLQRFNKDEKGVSVLELALIMPVLLTLGFYGTEVAYMASVNMQIGQMASSIADNASRLGQTDNSAVTPTVTQTQINSLMTGVLMEGAAFDFEDKGRVILSSLERHSTGRQYIHWQRCRGNLRQTSKYGREDPNRTAAAITGMGDPQIQAVSGTAVMFVEIFYEYEPIFGRMFMGTKTLSREAAFIVRDDRNLTPGVTPSTNDTSCNT